MNEADALDIVQYAIWTVLTASGPSVAAAMLVGVGIALIQALTQIQEITLTFVPKIVAIMLVVAFTGPFIGSQISAFTNVIFERIETGRAGHFVKQLFLEARDFSHLVQTSLFGGGHKRSAP